MGISRFGIWGHSLAFGGGSSDPDYDTSTRLSSALGGALEMSYAVGGARLMWADVADGSGNSVTGNGGFGKFLATFAMKSLWASTLSAGASAGATTLTITSTTGLTAGASTVNVGTGTNGEVHVVQQVRRVRECRIVAHVTTAGGAGGKLRLQYSPDSGTTWSNMARAGNMGAYTASQTDPLEIVTSSTGRKETLWVQIPPEAQVSNCYLRFLAISGTATAPQMTDLAVQFR